MKTRLFLAFVVFGCSESDVATRSTASDLRHEIDAGRVSIVWAAGNGSSSGAAIDAELISTTPIRLKINLARPLYLVNRGRGQNMVVVQVYMSDGGYTSDGTTSFIALQPNTRTRVAFTAFCMDFEKDNPTAQEQFSIGETPIDLLPVMRRITDYLEANPQSDAVSAAQAAIWLAQGVRMADIRARFNLTPADEALARHFLM